MYPSMHAVIRSVLSSEAADIVQYVLEPLALPSLFEDYTTHGDNFIRQLSYMTRTFAFYMQRQYKQLQSQQYSTPSIHDHNKSINFSVSGRRGWSSDCQSKPLGSQYYHPSTDTRAPVQYSLYSTSHAVTSSSGISSVSDLCLGGRVLPHIARVGSLTPANTTQNTLGWVRHQPWVTSSQHSLRDTDND